MSGLIWTATLTEKSSGGVDSIDERGEKEWLWNEKKRVKQEEEEEDEEEEEEEDEEDEEDEGVEMEFRKTRKIWRERA